MHRRQSLPTLLAIAAIAAASALVLLAAPAQAGLRHFEGTVIGKNTNTKTFRVETERGDRRFRTNAATRWERVHGLEGMQSGMRIEVVAVATRRGLLAREVALRGPDPSDVEDNGRGEDEPNEPEEGPAGSARPPRPGMPAI